MNQTKYLMNCGARLMKWPLRRGLLCLALARVALAVDPLYEVDYPVSYMVPGNPPPNIHATNFVNTATSFTVDFSTANFTFFETWNTVNYTNTGSMITDTGFEFDTQVTNSFGNTVHLMAGNFYNPGTISCASLTGSLLLGLAGQSIVNATNISMPGGTVVVGMGGGTAGGLISFAGQNVDLSDSTLTLEGSGVAGSGFGSVRAVPVYSGTTIYYYYSGFGLDTNAEWNPFADLTSVSALPSEVKVGPAATATWTLSPGFPSYPVLTTPYEVTTIPTGPNGPSTNDVIYRYVFLANTVSSVTANVYIDQSVANVPGTGAATVEFIGAYTNPATGLPANNYLYVRDDYLQGAGNNPGFDANTSIPNNFTVTPSSVQLVVGSPLGPNQFFPSFPNAYITNNYSFVDVECDPTSVPTNSITLNTNNYLAVLPGKLVINASSNLDMSHAQISGQNYLSVSVPIQLNGSVGAAISSAYSDINVGVTNGNLMATNLLEPSVPAWSGTVQAWSTRFINLTTNSIITIDTNNVATTNSYVVTNDYRVVIVANQAVPTTPTEVWNMALHGTNSIVISDVYNILNSLNLDCVSLTLTTNGPGAPAPFGELNLQNSSVNWAAATPHLRYLTNDGYILLPLSGVNSLGVFGGPAAHYGALINNGLIWDQGSQIWADNFENGGIFYNGVGQFTLQSLTTTLTGGNEGGYVYAGGDVSITTGSLLTSNLFLEADRSLTLTSTNLLTDTGVTNGSLWYVGLTSVGNGIKLPILPPGGGSGSDYSNSLLGTTIYLFAPSNRTVVNVWPGTNRGVSNAGYTNNLAVGRLILDSFGITNNTKFTFTGVGVSNALYVDYLELLDQATNRDSLGNPGALSINTNLWIYYAQAVINGVSVARKLDHKNNGHLRWVPSYTGYFSSTNLVYPDGTTNGPFNAALAQDSQIDSNGDGSPNSSDQTPFTTNILSPSQINLTYVFSPPLPLAPTNVTLTWYAVPPAINYICYSTNMSSWQFLAVVTNYTLNYAGDFSGYDNPTNSGLPNTVMTNTASLPVTGPVGMYKVAEFPWLTYPLVP